MAKEQAKRVIKAILPDRNEFNYVSFDMLETPIVDAVRECEYLPLGFDKKAVVLENCGFIKKGSRFKYQKDDDPEALLNYLSSPNSDVELFILVYTDSIEKGNDYIRLIEEDGGEIKEIKQLNNEGWIDYITSFFNKRGIRIDFPAAKELSKRINGDYGAFKNESQKLLTYTNGEPITIDIINKIVTPYLDDNIFLLSNSLTRGDIKGAMKVYKDLKAKTTVEEVSLIGMLANQFRFLDEVMFLDDEGLDNREIAKILSTSPIRVDIALKSLYRVKKKSIENILEELYTTQKSILNGTIPPELAFSLFLANYKL